MEDDEAVEEEQQKQRLHVPVLQLVGALERVRPMPHSSSSSSSPFLARISRAARAALDQGRWDGPLPLNAERAMLLFTVPRDAKPRNARALAPPCRASSRDGDSRGNREDADKKMRLTTSHAIGSRTMMDTVLEGTSIHVSELRIRLTHMPPLPRIGVGRISVTGGTDLRRRHRVAMESMMRTEDDKHSLSTIASTTDFSSPLAWGIASSHKFGHGLDLFARYSSDHSAGRSVIVQAVKRHGRITVSPIVSVASKGRVQAGITWKSTIFCSKEDESSDFLQVRALCNQKGVFSVFLKAQLGDPVQ